MDEVQLKVRFQKWIKDHHQEKRWTAENIMAEYWYQTRNKTINTEQELEQMIKKILQQFMDRIE